MTTRTITATITFMTMNMITSTSTTTTTTIITPAALTDTAIIMATATDLRRTIGVTA
jgi:hypothetical protein